MFARRRATRQGATGAMFDTMGRRLFVALASAARARIGDLHPCVVALEAAVASPGAEATAAAQAELNRLDSTIRDPLLAEAHRELAAQGLGILAAWPVGRGAPSH